MTRDEILAMEPGRKMDELVATSIMGFKLRGDYCYQTNEHGGETIYTFEESSFESFMPSTDMRAAWLVLEKHDDITVKRYEGMAGHRYWCRISEGHEEYLGYGLTGPEAITKAALIAKLEARE